MVTDLDKHVWAWGSAFGDPDFGVALQLLPEVHDVGPSLTVMVLLHPDSDVPLFDSLPDLRACMCARFDGNLLVLTLLISVATTHDLGISEGFLGEGTTPWDVSVND